MAHLALYIQVVSWIFLLYHSILGKVISFPKSEQGRRKEFFKGGGVVVLNVNS